MMVIGVDPHKLTHTAVAVDELGRRQASRAVQARREGHQALIGWGRQVAPGSRCWAVEDVRHVAGNLIRDLLAAGERVVFVPPRLMAGVRRGGRERGKSDPIDALAIARAAQREDTLPEGQLDAATRPVRLLADYRDVLVKERTAMISRLRWQLHDLDPALEPAKGTLDRAITRRKLAAALAGLPAGTGRQIALSQLARITSLSEEISSLERQLAALVTPLAAALLAIPGVSVLTAARLLGETGDIRRFRSPAAFARHNGTAPIPVSSGRPDGPYRLNKGGNRQINAALHRISLTQARCHPPPQAYLDHRATTCRETVKASRRAHKRHLSDTIYHAMTTDARNRDTTQPHAA